MEAPRPLTGGALQELEALLRPIAAGGSLPPHPPSIKAPSVTSEITQIDQSMDYAAYTDADGSSLLSSALSSIEEPSSLAPALSDTSSVLSDCPSRITTPSPFDVVNNMTPPSTVPKSKKRRSTPFPSPPNSQDSSRATPCPGDPSSSNATTDSENPAKRRKITMDRPTKRLNLKKLKDPEQQAELDRLLKALRTKKKIVVVAGAGISVSAGIPDFRSSDGLFKSLKTQNNLKSSGKDLFSANVYRDDQATEQFHDMVRTLHRDTATAKPTPFHHLIARLAAEDRLLRLYSQNVDGIDIALPPLETQVPLPRKGPWPKTVQLHGGLSKMVCTKCAELTDFESDLFEGPSAPDCAKCEELDHARTEIAGKRSHGVGKLRPRMVLYDESNPDDEAIGLCTKADWRRRPDCIIVVGTTLKIPGVRRIVSETCKIVRDRRDGLAVWINNDSDPPSTHFINCWDIMVTGTSDQVAKHADLGRWNDADLQFKVLSQEDIREVEERKKTVKPEVIVESPTKQRRHSEIDALPTPIASPRFEAKLKATEDPPVTREPGRGGRWLDTVMGPNDISITRTEAETTEANISASIFAKVDNPASRGKTINGVLGPFVQPVTSAKASKTTKIRPVTVKPEAAEVTIKANVKGAKGAAKPRKTATKSKVQPVQNGQIKFPVNKTNPALAKQAAVKDSKQKVDQSKVLVQSPTRENIPGTAFTRAKSKGLESGA